MIARRSLSAALFVLMLLTCLPEFAGGPRWVAGSAYFNNSVEGNAIIWAGGSLVYYTDQGDLSSFESNAAAAAMVAAAAAPWTQVATASVSITQGGTLDEDVNGTNVSGSRGDVTWPADVESTAKPLAVIYDADGSVLNTVLGAGGSDPSGCLTNAVTSFNDGFSPAANLTHAIVILNGLCATNANQIANMQYLLEREFGRILGLGWSQDDDNVLTLSPPPIGNDYAGWPLMHPVNVDCGSDNYSCLPTPYALRMDDRAALGRLYPSATFASATVHVHGTISFAGGQGMQGVNVRAILLVSQTTDQITSSEVSSVSGFGFRGNAGNVVTGTTDSAGNAMARFGSPVSWVEGQWDLGGLEYPVGAKYGRVDYQIVFEAVNPWYTGNEAVGPDILGTPAPSGTLATIYLRGMEPGQSFVENVVVANSATGGTGMAGSFASPIAIPANNQWQSWLSGYGDTAYAGFSARPNRQFALVTTAMNESGVPSQSKAMPVIGAWLADDAATAPPDFSTPAPFNSSSEGVTVLEVTTPAGDGVTSYPLTAAIADARGDGRPDYAYSARIFYADSVSPDVVPSSGGVIAIAGTGFVKGDSVQVNGVSAPVLAVSAEQIVAQAPAQNASGAVDVQLNDPTGAIAVMSGALVVSTAGDSSAYALNVVSVPGGSGGSSGSVGAVAPGAFALQVADSNGNPVSGAPVTFSDSNGSLLSACNGATSCTIATSTGGIASTTLTPQNVGVETITAGLTNGASARAFWTATLPAVIVQYASLPIEQKAGVAVSYPLTITVVKNGVPYADLPYTWLVTQANGASLSNGSGTTAGDGTATFTASIPALAVGAAQWVRACADSKCTTLVVTGVNPDAPVAVPWSGTAQTIAANTTFAPLVLEIIDGAMPANPVTGVTVGFTESLYSYEPAGTDGKQPPPRLLAQSTPTAISGVNGLVSIQPLQQAGTAGTAVITAALGSRTAGTWTLLAEPTVAPVTSGPVTPRKLPLPR